ncbi:hypothetical protein SAMN05421783_12564 [Thiocapsa roseopersicina]|uniref:Uncharacterized protein n=1 Tax=Thiocapsa roseopersicina TaxID=1058 RepID=A0A1H3BMC4_THIRO|nr:hypothetical protein SAMN05421783_12564 [Thiocapsa roseopersicina]
MVARLQALHAGSAFHHLAPALVAEHAGKGTLRILSGERERIGVTDARGDDLQQDLALFRTLHMGKWGQTTFFC